MSCFYRKLSCLVFIFAIYNCHLSFGADFPEKKIRRTSTSSAKAKKQIIRKAVKDKQKQEIRNKPKKSNAVDVNVLHKTIHVNSPLCLHSANNDVISLRKVLLKSNNKQSEINTICANGESILLVATKNNNYLSVKFLLENGADTNIQNDAGVSPLHIASRKDTKDMDRIFDLLIHQKNIDLNLKDLEGYTPLMRAVEFEKISVIKALVKRGADVGVKNNYGLNALELAQNALAGKKTAEDKAVSEHIVELLNKND